KIPPAFNKQWARAMRRASMVPVLAARMAVTQVPRLLPSIMAMGGQRQKPLLPQNQSQPDDGGAGLKYTGHYNAGDESQKIIVAQSAQPVEQHRVVFPGSKGCFQ